MRHKNLPTLQKRTSQTSSQESLHPYYLPGISFWKSHGMRSPCLSLIFLSLNTNCHLAFASFELHLGVKPERVCVVLSDLQLWKRRLPAHMRWHGYGASVWLPPEVRPALRQQDLHRWVTTKMTSQFPHTHTHTHTLELSQLFGCNICCMIGGRGQFQCSTDDLKEEKQQNEEVGGGDGSVGGGGWVSRQLPKFPLPFPRPRLI